MYSIREDSPHNWQGKEKSDSNKHGPLDRYVKWLIAHAPGMPGTFSPPPQVRDPDMHHSTRVTQPAILRVWYEAHVITSYGTFSLRGVCNQPFPYWHSKVKIITKVLSVTHLLDWRYHSFFFHFPFSLDQSLCYSAPFLAKVSESFRFLTLMVLHMWLVSVRGCFLLLMPVLLWQVYAWKLDICFNYVCMICMNLFNQQSGNSSSSYLVFFIHSRFLSFNSIPYMTLNGNKPKIYWTTIILAYAITRRWLRVHVCGNYSWPKPFPTEPCKGDEKQELYMYLHVV